jgi:hypothetical protein
MCPTCGGTSAGAAMPIDPSLEQGAFEPEATAAMGEAFDAACKELYCTGQPEVVRELIAALIVAAASRGELDPIRLRTVALAGFAMAQRCSPCSAPNARANLVAGRIIFDPVGSSSLSPEIFNRFGANAV